MATNSGILVIGNTESNATEILSDTGVLARVLSPSSLVVASSGGASSLLNCDAVSNTTGADGDLAECLDTRTHTHPAEAIAANGGNADFFDRKYDIIKMNGKWWMNEPLKYPRSSDYHIPPAWGGGLSWGCPGTVSS